MSFRILILCLIFSVMTAFSAEVTLNAKFVSGKVEMQKKATGKWLPVRVGAKLRQADRLRTYASAEAIFSFDNGSEIRVQENSILDMTELKSDQGGNSTNLSVRRGNLLFNIKKLSQQDQFKFETATATAAIRGTIGGIGSQGDRTVAYLDEGALDLEPKNGGTKVRIGPKEFALQGIQGFQVQAWSGKTAIADVFQKIIKDSTVQIHSLDSTFKILKNLDSIKFNIKDTLSKTKESDGGGSSELGGQINDYETKTTQTKLSLSGKCFGPAISVAAGEFQSKPSADGSWNLDLFWALSSVGNKTFNVTCQYEKQRVEIGVVKFEYSLPKEEYTLNLLTPSRVRIVDGLLVVEGAYVGKDAVLRLQIGPKTYDLTSLSGKFRQEIEITDKAGTWELTKADLSLSGPQGVLTQSIEIEVDKNSKKVNTLAPDFSAKIDPLRGVILMYLQKSLGDPTVISTIVDGEELQSFEARSDFQAKPQPLKVGMHSYQVVAIDQAANRKMVDLGQVEYWLKSDFSIDVSTRLTEGSVLRLPPMPPGLAQTAVSDRLTLEIKGLPDDSPKYLDEILIVNSANGYRKSIRTQDIKELRMEFDMPLAINKINPISIRVTAKNGLYKEWSRNLQVQR